MSNIIEQSAWRDNVNQLETTDAVLGGASGPANAAAKALADRTRYLYDRLGAAGLRTGATVYSGSLDVLQTPGHYAATDAATETPNGVWGTLIVTGAPAFADDGDESVAYQLFSDAVGTYQRRRSGGVWRQWARVILSTDRVDFTPVGAVTHFAGTVAPDNWLFCHGQALLRSEYPELYAVIGIAFGTNGTTDFNLPDTRGEFIRGLDNGRGVDEGRAMGTPQSDEFRSHTHGYSDSYTNTQSNAPAGTNTTTGAVNAAKTTDAVGGPETRPRNIALNTIIKFK